MSPRQRHDQATRNRLLAAVSSSTRERLLQEADIISMSTKQVLYEPDLPIQHVYFPLSGVVSVTSQTKDGPTAEVLTIGNEGMVGLPIFLRAESMPLQAFAQIPGESLGIDAGRFVKALDAVGEELSTVLHRYVLAVFNQLAQGTACNGIHTIEERCARWLLMTHDRVETDEFPLTHEFLAAMLGVRRASVTVAAGTLQKAGLIKYDRGIIHVLDRVGLQEASCEHYMMIKKEYDRLIGKPSGR